MDCRHTKTFCRHAKVCTFNESAIGKCRSCSNFSGTVHAAYQSRKSCDNHEACSVDTMYACFKLESDKRVEAMDKGVEI